MIPVRVNTASRHPYRGEAKWEGPDPLPLGCDSQSESKLNCSSGDVFMVHRRHSQC